MMAHKHKNLIGAYNRYCQQYIMLSSYVASMCECVMLHRDHIHTCQLFTNIMYNNACIYMYNM